MLQACRLASTCIAPLSATWRSRVVTHNLQRGQHPSSGTSTKANCLCDELGARSWARSRRSRRPATPRVFEHVDRHRSPHAHMLTFARLRASQCTHTDKWTHNRNWRKLAIRAAPIHRLYYVHGTAWVMVRSGWCCRNHACGAHTVGQPRNGQTTRLSTTLSTTPLRIPCGGTDAAA